MNPDLELLDRLLLAAGTRKTGRREMLIVDGPPKSKMRPRFARGRTYAADSIDQTALAMRFMTIDRYEGNVAVAAVFYRPNRQRIDLDNMLKLVLDAATEAGVWKDDSQVTCTLGRIELDPERPRTLVGFAEDSSSLNRSIPTNICRQCGRTFELMYGNSHVFCSPRCRGQSLKQKKLHPGQGRGPKNQPHTPCQDCGVPLSKRSYLRCRSCWKAARRLGIS